MAKKTKVFIDRDKINGMILEIGKEQWDNFTAKPLKQIGNQYRCNMYVGKRNAMIDFYFNKDGTTTISLIGSNIDISSVVKTKLEERCKYDAKSSGKTYSFRDLPPEHVKNLIEHLESLENVELKTLAPLVIPKHESYKFSSKIGDKLTINHYETGTITLQGKPAYLYNETIAFLASCDDISMDDIIDSTNHFHDTYVATNDVQAEMKKQLPYSYAHLDATLLKLLSPSISLRRIELSLDDYSCYAFSALKALEGYIKYLLRIKEIPVKNTFGSIFCKGKLSPQCEQKVANVIYQQELERLYHYYVNTRHSLFHAKQGLTETKTLHTKREADQIIDTVLELIETSYIKVKANVPQSTVS